MTKLQEDYLTPRQRAYWDRALSKTGRMLWSESFGPSEGTFEDKAVEETVYCREADFGTQSGTQWKTARLHDGMTVWRWGGLPDVERFIIERRRRCDHGAPDHEPCADCQSEAERDWLARTKPRNA